MECKSRSRMGMFLITIQTQNKAPQTTQNKLKGKQRKTICSKIKKRKFGKYDKKVFQWLLGVVFLQSVLRQKNNKQKKPIQPMREKQMRVGFVALESFSLSTFPFLSTNSAENRNYRFISFILLQITMCIYTWEL